MGKTLYEKNPNTIENIGVQSNPHVFCTRYGFKPSFKTTFQMEVNGKIISIEK